MAETENKVITEPEDMAKEEPKEKKPKEAKKVDPWKKMIPIYLDKSLGGDAKYVYAGVNGHVYQVPTGMDIEVPAPIHEVLGRLKIQMRVLDGVRAEIAKENRENLKQLG